VKKVIVASDNPVKIAVAQAAFAAVYPDERFEIIAQKTHSGVSNNPFGDEALVGAMNRMEIVTRQYPDAAFWMSQEGGLFNDGVTMSNRAWIVVADGCGHIGQSSTPSFEIPAAVAKMVRTGIELGDAWDAFFRATNLKRAGGGVGRLTDGLIDRKHYYLQAAIIALCQVKHHDWYE
jgi:inosine/xanthosine triphosphatase